MHLSINILKYYGKFVKKYSFLVKSSSFRKMRGVFGEKYENRADFTWKSWNKIHAFSG